MKNTWWARIAELENRTELIRRGIDLQKWIRQYNPQTEQEYWALSEAVPNGLYLPCLFYVVQKLREAKFASLNPNDDHSGINSLGEHFNALAN